MKFDIVGLTLAEVALVLLFGFMALNLPAAHHKLEEVKELRLENTRLNEEIKEVKERNDLLAQATATDKSKRSRATPSCAENDPNIGWLFTVTIRNTDDYVIGNEHLDLKGILAKFSAEIQFARANNCLHRIKVLLGREISAGNYDLALGRLEDYFYTKRLGVER